MLTAAVLATSLSASRLLAADAPAADVAAAVKADLAAGEFSPALRRVEQLQDQNARDGLLNEIASAQRAAGLPDAAAQTLGRIGDDRQRGGAVAAILAQQLAPPNPILAQNGLAGGGQQVGGGGGSAGQNLDFQPIMDLIKATIEPDSWDDAGGPGAIKDFPGGVLVDTNGLLQRIVKNDTTGSLEVLRRDAATQGANTEARRAAPLRKISLTRLERALQMARAAGRAPDEAMRMLAGLQSIEYVLVYPETHDIVLAGPAGDWRRLAEGRVVSVETGHPVVQLEDLVVILRHASKEGMARFGCSIDPLPENVAKTQEYANQSAKHKLAEGAGAVKEFADAIQRHMGQQKIDVFGIDPRTHVGRVLVEADYRMKLVGLGREKPAGDLVSYWDTLKGKPQPEMLLVRWWFTLNYDAVQATPEHTAYAIRGQGVKLLSENEMLAEKGRRVATGKSDELNRRFAQSFTKNFNAMAAKYPIYAELHNMFDLALACSLITSEKLPQQVGWHMSGLLDEAQYQVPLGPAPKTVESVARYSQPDDRGRFIVQVSGGVRVDTQQMVGRGKIETATGPSLSTELGRSRPVAKDTITWWWD
ncbi:MAG: DUF1598 domain-containing protein [Planctomycetia bacterium]|nr:DUF1598 domain-containing protein [Planctomycetia bacterium]